MGTESDDGSGKQVRDQLFRCLRTRSRREILSALLRWGTPQTEHKLAEYVAATMERTSAPSPETIRQTRIEL